jgi:Reverse transcriptase (RNA-dependent DNA polymerase)
VQAMLSRLALRTLALASPRARREEITADPVLISEAVSGPGGARGVALPSSLPGRRPPTSTSPTTQQPSPTRENPQAEKIPHTRLTSASYGGVYIPKPDGRQRPLGIAALEDKIVQRAVVEVLNAIYEVDFRGFSYGFRPGRGPHDALDALSVGITSRRVNWVLDADIRDFFGQLDRAWLRRFLEHRIADERLLRLIEKWLAAGVVEDGEWMACEQGSPQGSLCAAAHNDPCGVPSTVACLIPSTITPASRYLRMSLRILRSDTLRATRAMSTSN